MREPHVPEADAEFAKSLGVADGDLAKMRADIKANLEREVKRRAGTRVKDQVMKALLDATRVEVAQGAAGHGNRSPDAQHASRSGGARSQGREECRCRREAFEPEARRRVSLGLILGELVKKHGLEAKPDQIKAVVGEYAQSYEKPEEVLRWYYQSPERLREVESIVLEDNVVQWVLANARVEDKATEFDDLMGNAK